MALVSVIVAGGNGVGRSAHAQSDSLSVPTGPTMSASPLVAVTPLVTDPATSTTLGPLVCTNSYTVAAGDFWVRIARRATITTSALLTANRAASDTPLYPDQVICLPDGVAVVVPTTQVALTTTLATAPATTVKPKPARVTTPPSSNSHASK